MSSFTPTTRARLRRLSERGSYDRAAIFPILDAGLICHVGYLIDGQPYVTPTCYWRDGDRLYWHGSRASRMVRAVQDGAAVCLTVTHLDGVVFARSGFHSSINYRSVMAFGRAFPVDDPAAKLRALVAFSERIAPGRWPELRPTTKQELKATTVLEMEIEEASAKVRSGPPIDDEDEYDLDVWAGVLPLGMEASAPQAEAHVKPGIGIPAYLSRLRLG